MDRLGQSPDVRSISLNSLTRAYLDLIHKARVASLLALVCIVWILELHGMVTAIPLHSLPCRLGFSPNLP